MNDDMSPEDEKKEFEEYASTMAKEESLKIMIDEYQDLAKLSNCPPLNLNSNYFSFQSDLTEALKTINTVDEYDKSIINKVKMRYKSEIEKAQLYFSRYPNAKEATKAYIKDSETSSISEQDFSLSGVLR